jgi:hypothetical protein
MKINKTQLRRLIREERHKLIEDMHTEVEENSTEVSDHHWPRVDWDMAVGDLVDKWAEGEIGDWEGDSDTATKDGELTKAEAKEWYAEQVDTASQDLEVELVTQIRKLALRTMKDFTERLMNGDYDR